MGTEFLTMNLAIEPDVQHFIGLAHGAVADLGASGFASAPALVRLARRLRMAGAGSGRPLPVSLRLAGQRLLVAWGEEVEEIARINGSLDENRIETLRQKLKRSTELEDPAVLLRRNEEMHRFLEETRARTERELARLSAMLEKHRSELAKSQQEAETDALTGLYNRRAYDARLARAFMEASQGGPPLALLLCDLDRFKEINDNHGHRYGDEYLKRMAEAMRCAIRSGVDAAFRFGGDEFAVMLRAPKDVAIQRALQILAAMEGRVSLGLATVSLAEPCVSTLEGFVERADHALYEAKRRGRGRLVVDHCDGQGQIGFVEYRLEAHA